MPARDFFFCLGRKNPRPGKGAGSVTEAAASSEAVSECGGGPFKQNGD